MPSFATCPRVFPCPYIAISNVPGGKSLAEEFLRPASVIFSAVSVIVPNWISPVVTQGMSPPQ
ncbi:hypothetical protein D3C87_1077200 [compost metagenome]